MAEPPALVACSHGTRDLAGRQAVDDLRAAVASARRGLRVVEAYVDVQQPELSDVLDGLGPAVVVPVLLSSGYHVHVDITDAVAGAGPQVRVAAALGPHPALVEVLAERLDGAAASPDHAVVLAAAGSSDRRAVSDVERTASELAKRLGRPVLAAYASAALPRVDEAVGQLQSAARPVAIASYLLAPGFFYDQLATAGAEVVTAPLLPHPAITALVLERYDEAASADGQLA
ncbi:MAG TPA: CbiX/SirB N-terminal domain-containing protein [Jiangellaceae bacterium]|nr:CbiX/SirB N-terminal domain-containing protein [Jiangellaceae bacterium]